MILVGSLRIAEPKSGCQESPETPKEFVILPGRVDGAGPAQGVLGSAVLRLAQ